MAKWLSNQPRKLKPPLTRTVFCFPLEFKFILGFYHITKTYLSLKIAHFAMNSSPRKLSVQQNLRYWNIYSNKTMQSLPPQVLSTTFRFVEEILSAKLIKVKYFPGSLLMYCWLSLAESSSQTPWLPELNKQTNQQTFNKEISKKAALLVIIFEKLVDFCAYSHLTLWHLSSIQKLTNNS